MPAGTGGCCLRLRNISLWTFEHGLHRILMYIRSGRYTMKPGTLQVIKHKGWEHGTCYVKLAISSLDSGFNLGSRATRSAVNLAVTMLHKRNHKRQTCTECMPTCQPVGINSIKSRVDRPDVHVGAQTNLLEFQNLDKEVVSCIKKSSHHQHAKMHLKIHLATSLVAVGTQQNAKHMGFYVHHRKHFFARSGFFCQRPLRRELLFGFCTSSTTNRTLLPLYVNRASSHNSKSSPGTLHDER